jgi:hypothetical protein
LDFDEQGYHAKNSEAAVKGRLILLEYLNVTPNLASLGKRDSQLCSQPLLARMESRTLHRKNSPSKSNRMKLDTFYKVGDKTEQKQMGYSAWQKAGSNPGVGDEESQYQSDYYNNSI